MLLDIRLPYDNGAPLSTMIVMMRWVKPFDKGDWFSPRSFRLDDASDERVEVLEAVDPNKLLKELLAQQRREEEERKSGYNPLKKKKDGINIAAILSAAKPDGSLVRVWIDRLESDTVYEFRVSVRNAAGFSDYSNPSHRSKTNKARTPGPPSDFTIIEVTPSLVTFTANWTMQGGAYIDMYLAEMLRKSENGNEKTFRVKWERPGPPYDNPHQSVTLTITDHLHPGEVYQWRVCAENEIGSGPWSEWTEDVLIPGDAADVAAAVAAEEAASAAAEAAEDDAEIDGEEDEDLAEFAAVLKTKTKTADSAAGAAGGGAREMATQKVKIPPTSKKAP
jgi:hypothetical protein